MQPVQGNTQLDYDYATSARRQVVSMTIIIIVQGKIKIKMKEQNME